MKRSIPVTLVLGGVLAAALPAEGQVLRSGILGEPPVVTARLLDGELRPGTGDTTVVTIIVRVPPGHHGYLDVGDEGYYIPFTFAFGELQRNGASLSPKTRPEGVRDEMAAARVLRGSGRFDFDLQGAGRLPRGALLHASLTYQICDDVSRLCYPPRETRIPIPIAEGRHRP